MSVAIATFNCGNDVPAKTPIDLDLIDADIYCLQETGDRHAVVDEWCVRRGFRQVPFRRGTGDTPQLYDPTRVRLLTYFDYVVNPKPMDVGPVGDGPTIIHPKFITHAVYEDLRTKRKINVLNTHLVASWTRNDLPPAEEKVRRGLGDLHIRILVDALRPLRSVVVPCGDFNAQKTFPGMAPLADAVTLGDTANTQANNVIDFAGVRGQNVIRFDHEVITGTSSDHNAVVLHLTLRSAA